jgi:hypothetical protein
VSGTHPIHGYRSQYLQLDGRIGEQYLVDGLVEQFSSALFSLFQNGFSLVYVVCLNDFL